MGLDRHDPGGGMLSGGDVFLANYQPLVIGSMASLDPAASTPFRPFSLGPGEGRGVMLVLRFDHCEDYGLGSASTFQSIRVHFRVLGFSRFARLDLAEGIMVKAPSDSNCPQRATAR